jgi:hypothetical protein
VLAKQPLHLTPEQIHWLAVAPILLVVVGAYTASAISDRVSRKTVHRLQSRHRRRREPIHLMTRQSKVPTTAISRKAKPKVRGFGDVVLTPADLEYE